MKPIHYIAIFSALAITLVIYFGGNTVKPSIKSQNVFMSQEDDHEHTNAMGMPLADPIAFNKLEELALLKVSPETRKQISAVQAKLNQSQELKTQIANYEELGKVWLDNKNRKIAAHYFLLSGKLENSEKKLNFAAHLLSEELHHEQDPSVRQWMVNTAEEAFQKSLAINPNNDTTKIDFAQLYIEGAGDVMKGVGILLAIVDKNPKHIPVNVILGRMAVESGQYEKAIERANTILKQEPEHLEAHLFLGEAYKRSGDIEKAIETFNAAKKILNNPEFSKDIDNYIESFTNEVK